MAYFKFSSILSQQLLYCVLLTNHNMKRPDWDIYFMLQAEVAKLRSNCLTRHIGAIIVKDNRQIATGYNGTPSGIKNCYEGGCQRCLSRIKGEIRSGEHLDRCLCTHAGSTRGATLYSTFAPCLECSKMAISVGITRIVVLASYPEDGTQLLKEAKIKLQKLNQNSLMYWIMLISKDPGASPKIMDKT